jgi:FKBP-type peptidyl-prolyl cis-trans isomerase SlyD
VQEALQGHRAGAKLDLHLEPEEAFGDFNDQLIFLEPRALFPKELEEGLTFEGSALPAGCTVTMPKDVIYVVTDVFPEHVVLDGNHPLAGIAIRLHLKIIDVRQATIDEIGSGTCGSGFFKLHTDAGVLPGNNTVH